MTIPKINESKLLESKLQSEYPCLLIKKKKNDLLFLYFLRNSAQFFATEANPSPMGLTWARGGLVGWHL